MSEVLCVLGGGCVALVTSFRKCRIEGSGLDRADGADSTISRVRNRNVSPVSKKYLWETDRALAVRSSGQEAAWHFVFWTFGDKTKAWGVGDFQRWRIYRNYQQSGGLSMDYIYLSTFLPIYLQTSLGSQQGSQRWQDSLMQYQGLRIGQS